ncbi:GPI anchored serine-threonine rich family protein [Aspergillus udagawae]|uniref:SMP-30 gluconolaconase LRE domain protein n=1 Tax=Aspergillus udagawae TaxID=91492 RepID=A0A8E0UU87_9EURO|nr:SMP-30 gluconolaconase LRE domain protein [Aspergillus udagawae]GIC86052.1 SMP-30 gluconolaconase LRE domain protein [Aspergillus udagawae]
MRFALTLTALVGSAAALSITSPQKDQDVDLSEKTKVEWSSVSSDPSSFDIYLVKMNSYPPINKLVAENVKTSDGSYTIDGLSADSGSGYQVNFVSKDPKNTGILAQSQQFKVESSGSSTTSDSASSTTATESSSTASHSSTGTVSTTASTSGTASASTLSTTASGTASKTTSPTASHASSSASGTSTASTTPNGAGSLSIPAGSLLLGLAVLAL